MSLPSAAGAATSPRPCRRHARAKRRATWRRRATVALFLSPWIVGFGVFFGYPIVWSAYLSLTHYDLLNPPRWVGLRNYRYLFHGDAQVWPSVHNTLWLVVFLVPLQVLFGFSVAVMLTWARWGSGFFRTVFYLPSLVPGGCDARVRLRLQPGDGPVNTILAKLGVEGPLWFNDPSWAKPSLGLLALWGIGNIMIILSSPESSTCRGTCTSRPTSTAPAPSRSCAG